MAKRTPAQKRAIKKAQRTWDIMHYSVAEGKIPDKLASGGQVYTYVKGSKTADCRKASKKADNIRKRGFKVRTKQLTVKGKDVCLVYKGPPRKKTVRVPKGCGPKGQCHSAYTRTLPTWKKQTRIPGQGKG